jgi:outer membrane protein insertion porin family
MTLQDFYRRHGYLSAMVDSVAIRYEGSSDRADVHFHLTEGPRARVESVRFEGVGPIPEKELRSALVLSEKDPFDVPRQDLSRQAVENRYAERGYVAARVRDSLEIDQARVGIVYRIDPGPRVVLDRVHVEGTVETKPAFVAREVVLKPGDFLARSRLLLSQQRIYDSGFYSDVQFDRGAIDSATLATDLIIGVRERKMGWVDAGVGYGTVDQFRVTSQVGQRNLWKDGFRFVATGRLGVRLQDEPFMARIGDRRLDVALSRLWILGVRMNATVGGYAEEIPGKVSEPDSIPRYPYRAYGGSLTLGYDLIRHTRTLLSYENRKVLSDSSSRTTPLGDRRQSYTKNSMVLTVDRDTRVNIFDPTSGTDLLGNAEFVGGVFRGGAQFLKLSGTASAYQPAGRKATIALRLRVGNIKPQGQGPAQSLADSLTPLDLIPVEDRFRTGGATSVRGYQDNELGSRVGDIGGGRILLLGNAELRLRLFWILGAVAFVDAGNVWERREDLKLRKILSLANGAGYNDMRYSAGVGLRLGTPIGPLRFDYGWKLRMARSDQPDPVSGRGEFHFSVGQAF